MSGARREKGGDFCATQDTKEGWVLENVGGWSTSTSRVEPIEHASEKYPELRVVGTQRSVGKNKSSRMFLLLLLVVVLLLLPNVFLSTLQVLSTPYQTPTH